MRAGPLTGEEGSLTFCLSLQEVALERNAGRPVVEKMPEAVLLKHFETLQPPTPEKLAWEAACVVLQPAENVEGLQSW